MPATEDTAMPYRHLFAAPRAQDFIAEADAFGRETLVEQRWPDTDPGWDAARADWMNGAPLTKIVGDNPFALFGSVGRNKQNRRGDVFRLQALLHREGHLDSEATEGPTGYWGNRDDAALRAFQKENGLTVDGYADPDGETISTIRRFYRPQKPVFRRTLEMGADTPRGRIQTWEWRNGDAPGRRVPFNGQSNTSAPSTEPRQYAQAQEVQSDAAPERQPPERPTLNLEKDRRRTILENTPARFDIAENPKEDGAAPYWRDHNFGREMVQEYDRIIEHAAKTQGVDPDLVRAIMYYENADGRKGGLDTFLDAVGLSRSQRPMSIRSDIWSPLGLPEDKATDPETNIRAATVLLSRIIDRTGNMSPEAIGTLWNSLSQEVVTERGARIGRVYRERLWEKPNEVNEVGHGYP